MEEVSASRYETKRCLCVRLLYYPETNTKVCGEWEVNLCMPSFVVFLITSSYVLSMFIFPHLNKHIRWFKYLYTVIFLIYIISYIRIIYDGPGYFPFYYPFKRPNSSIDSDNLLEDDIASGFMTTKEQENWARMQTHPNRCILSHTAKRIVIRPDHYCDFTTTWIGKRNHKFFILFLAWGSLYILCFLFLTSYGLIYNINNNLSIFMTGFLFIYLFIGFLFFLFTGIHLFVQCSLVSKNLTSWEEWNKIVQEKYDKGCIHNWEDICGSSSRFYFWPFPFSPFNGRKNDELIADYEPYGKRIIYCEDD